MNKLEEALDMEETVIKFALAAMFTAATEVAQGQYKASTTEVATRGIAMADELVAQFKQKKLHQ